MCKVFDGFILKLTFCRRVNDLKIKIKHRAEETIKPFN